MRREAMGHKFVEYIPNDLEEGVVYISGEFAVTAHLCCCGCGREVSLPLSPADWRLTFDGSISLSPSIGRPGWPCESHYWIHGSRVVWAKKLSPSAVSANVACNGAAREAFLEPQPDESAAAAPGSARHGRARRLLERLFRSGPG